MQNKRITFVFLSLMVVALVTLAMLQYRWLGSVSEAEKKRLEENLNASTENFISDFNEVFSRLNAGFQIQVSKPDVNVGEMAWQRWQQWQANSAYPTLVEGIYILKKNENEAQTVQVQQLRAAQLETIIPGKHLSRWIENEFSTPLNNRQLLLGSIPEFSDQTYFKLPIQLVDFIQLSRENGEKHMEVRLNLEMLDDVILLDLNDELIKTKIIPEIAARYFSASFADQYQLALVNNSDSLYVYYQSDSDALDEKPEFTRSLSRFDISNMLILGTDAFGAVDVEENEVTDSLELSYWESRESLKTISDTLNGHFSQIRVISTGTAEPQPGPSNHQTRPNIHQIDTTISASFVDNVAGNPWQLWLSFKTGSLDAFVFKTRNRNLLISFSILGILGISVVMIVLASQRLRELAEQQMLFVAGVSHELRTPLSVIRSAAENLSEGVVQTEERKKEYAKLMLKEGRRLSDMVDQIMEFSGIQTGKRVYSFSQIHITELVENIQEEYIPIFQEQGITLEYSNMLKNDVLYADRDALALAISNLLSNAVKFSNGSSRIVFRMDEDILNGQACLRIQVQDFGIGIPADEQTEVFKPFFRGRKTQENQIKGNGIGLSLVRKVAEAHHGKVAVKSVEEQGSTFSILIPFQP
jgi:signal transduction histidine kinase